MLRVTLSHDIDRAKKHHQYFTYFIKSMYKGIFKNALSQILSIFSKEAYWNFSEIIRIEEEYKVKSTFFFLDESIPFELFNKKNWQLSLGRYNINQNKIKKIIRWLDQNGWEIGVHGSYLSYKDEKLLKREKVLNLASTKLPDEGPGLLIFGSALNLLLFSPTYGDVIFEKIKNTIVSNTDKTYLFSVSTLAKAEEIANNLILSRSQKKPFRLFIKILKIRDEQYDSAEVQVPISPKTLDHIKEIADHSRSKVIPAILKI